MTPNPPPKQLSNPSLAGAEHHHADLGDVQLHYVTMGKASTNTSANNLPVVLLHGWPQSWYAWRHVMPELAKTRLVIAPDLRGLGDSSRPLEGYDKKTIANDIWRLLHEHLGLTEFCLVGHDWGGPTAYALAAAHPEAVRKLAVLDVTIPGDGGTNFSQGGRRWHHAFHQTADLPEALIAGREQIYFTWFYRNWGHHSNVLSDQAIAEYLRVYSQPGALRAGFSYYRNLSRDMLDNQAITQIFKLAMPVLALGGNKGWGRGTEVLDSLQRLGTDVRGGVIDNCGHWMAEEQPDALLVHLLPFLAA
jgi:pimeloyl-ACP methyl ester carboxylesterase